MAVSPTGSMPGMVMPPATTTATTGGGSATPPKVTPAQVTQTAAKMGGGCGGAMGGVAQLSGGGGADMSSLATMLGSITQALQGLIAAIQKLVGGGGPIQTGVKGMSGNTATAPAAPAAPTAPATPPASVSFANTGTEQTAYEQKVLQLINQQRAQYGLGPVQYDSALDAAATGHNAQQVSTRTMAHINIGDADPGSRVRAQGWRGAWGENVAVGQTSPEQVVSEWMNSPTHRANILNPNYRYMGVSYQQTADGHPFWAQEFGG